MALLPDGPQVPAAVAGAFPAGTSVVEADAGAVGAGARVRFVVRGRVVSLDGVPAGLTVLDWLREHEHRVGTKDGCRAGDCGACTVVTAELGGDEDSRLRFRPVDSCITPLRHLDGRALWTVEDLAGPDGALHPVQQAIVDRHATQCGFCTPGVVMSLFALYQQAVAPAADAAGSVSRAEAVRSISGNLCRCTGYRSIVDAALAMSSYPTVAVDERAIAGLLRSLRSERSLASVLRARHDRPDAVVLAGGTDVMVTLDESRAELTDVISLRGVRELETIEEDSVRLTIGAAVPIEDAWTALSASRPGLETYAHRFGGPQVRGAGTVGGNIMTASPVGDTMPVLLALGATLLLASVDGVRSVPIEEFFPGYRRTALRPDELLVSVAVAPPEPGELVVARKHSRRYDDDISTVSLALCVLERGGRVVEARIGVGGVAATPSRAPRTEAALLGAPWSWASVSAAAEVLRGEFTPIDDVRASAVHRRDELAALLLEAWPGDRP